LPTTLVFISFDDAADTHRVDEKGNEINRERAVPSKLELTAKAIRTLAQEAKDTNAILHVTC